MKMFLRKQNEKTGITIDAFAIIRFNDEQLKIAVNSMLNSEKIISCTTKNGYVITKIETAA